MTLKVVTVSLPAFDCSFAHLSTEGLPGLMTAPYF